MGITQRIPNLFYPLKPINSINKAPQRYTTLFQIMQTGYYPTNTQFYPQ
nr:MAG TPA: hypothetical protein [Caudoviricetes sp.]